MHECVSNLWDSFSFYLELAMERKNREILKGAYGGNGRTFWLSTLSAAFVKEKSMKCNLVTRLEKPIRQIRGRKLPTIRKLRDFFSFDNHLSIFYV